MYSSRKDEKVKPKKQVEIKLHTERDSDTLKLIKQLNTILFHNHKIIRLPKRSDKSIKEMKTLISKRSMEDIAEMIEWLDKNLDRPYLPGIFSVTSFVQKYPQLEDYRRREKQKSTKRQVDFGEDSYDRETINYTQVGEVIKGGKWTPDPCITGDEPW